MEKPRLLFIDNLRILLISLVIIVHLSVTYGGVGLWYYKEGQPDALSSAVLTSHNAIIQSFFMGLFFLIAGYFTPGSYNRKGPQRFIKDRLLRLGIPMLFYDFVINPLLVYLLIKANVAKFDGTFPEFLATYYRHPHIGGLWFVETLLIFDILYLLLRLFVKPTVETVRSTSTLPGNGTAIILALVLGLVSFVVRIWFPIGWTLPLFNLQLCFFPPYVCLFIVGIMAYHHDWLMHIPDAMGRFWLFVAGFFIVILLPALFVLGGAIKDVSPFMGGLHWQCFVYSLWEHFVGVAIIVALLVLFRERLNHQAAVAKAASASTYTAYIIHAPVIVLLTLAMRNIRIYLLAKFALAVVIAVPLCFALSNFVRKLPLARRIL